MHIVFANDPGKACTAGRKTPTAVSKVDVSKGCDLSQADVNSGMHTHTMVWRSQCNHCCAGLHGVS